MDKKIMIDQFSFFAPLIAAQLLTVYYSVLLLKQQQGIALTPEIENETMKDIFSEWAEIQRILEQIPKKQQTHQKPSGQGEE